MADVRQIITDAAKRYGIPPEDMLKMAQIESRMNPSARSPRSSAGGLFQFLDGTWAQYGRGSKFDAAANADAAARLLLDNKRYLEKHLGRAVNGGELYLAHQQGPGGALKLLRNPNASAESIVGSRAVRDNGGHSGMTAGQFAGLWLKRMGATVPGNGPEVETPSLVPTSMQETNNPGDYNVHTPGIVPTNTVVPTLNTTRTEEVAAQQEADKNAAGYVEGAEIAIKNNWSVLSPFRTLGHFDEDPNYKLDKPKLEALSRGVPDSMIDEFSDAISDSHAQAIRDRIMKQLKDNERLASMGTAGTVLNMGAALTDPGALAAAVAIGAVTEGIGAPAVMAARVGMAGRIALKATEAVAANVATEAPLIAVDPSRDMSFDELKWSIGTGLVLGGALGGIARNPQLGEVASKMEAIGHDMKNTSIKQPSSVGAASVGIKDATSEKVHDLLQDFRDIDPKGKFLGVRFDVVGQMLRSKNPMVRGLAQYFGEDGVRSAKGNVTEIAATERMQRLYRVAKANYTVGYDNAWKAYRKAKGINAWKAPDAEVQFKSDIMDYLRQDNASSRTSFAPEVAQAAAAFKKEMDNFWKMAKEVGITRSEMGVKNYVPRYANLKKATELMARFGFDGPKELYKRAIMAKQPNIDEALADKLGGAILLRMQKSASGENYMGMGRLGVDMDSFEEELGSFLSPNDIENVKAAMTGHAKPDGTGSPHMKHRIDLDENFSATLTDKHGIPQEVNISDFYIKDPHVAFNLYSRNMSGQLALAKIQVRSAPDWEGKTHLLIDGIKSRADYDKLRTQIQQTALEAGADAKSDLDNLDFLYSAITGMPYKGRDGGDGWSTFLRMFKDYNFIRLMGQVGFSQVPEFGRVAAQSGVTTLFQAVPSFRHFINMVRAGKMTDEMADEIHGMFAPGTDYIRSSHFIDADDLGMPVTQGSDTAIQRVAGAVQPKLHAASRLVTTFSGMRHVNQLLQQWAARAGAVKFVKMAMFKDKVDWNRMKVLGLNEDDAKAIFKEIETNAKFRGNVKAPSKVSALGLDKWNPTTRAKFEDAMFRLNRTMVLENDPGMMAKWMNSPFGSMLMQFRSFTVGSYSKAFLQGLNMNDKQAWGGFLAGAMTGSMVYAMQQYLNLMGDPDRDEKLKQRLNPANLAAAAFARTSESSILPMLIDSPVSWMTGHRIFDVRSSGLKSDVMGSPLGDLLNTGNDMLQSVGTAATGDDFSRQDFGNVRRVLPFQNMMGFTQFMNWLSSGLPKRELRD